MSANHTRDVLVFAGQGSNQHLVDAEGLENLRALLGATQKLAFSKFLKKARDTLRDEYASCNGNGKLQWGDNIGQAFDDAEQLLVPPSNLQTNPLFETISLYTRHILELIVYQSHRRHGHVSETSGICTGILPAILAAAFTSYDSNDFLAAAVDGIRLAFWIGVRSASALSFKETGGESLGPGSCVLGVFGVSEDRMRDLLKAFEGEVDFRHIDSMLLPGRLTVIFAGTQRRYRSLGSL